MRAEGVLTGFLFLAAVLNTEVLDADGAPVGIEGLARVLVQIEAQPGPQTRVFPNGYRDARIVAQGKQARLGERLAGHITLVAAAIAVKAGGG